MSGNDPAPGIEANADRTIFQPMPFPRPGMAASRFNRGPERAARVARRISGGDNDPPVLARWMQEAFGVLGGTRGGGAEATFTIGGRNLRYRFRSSAGPKPLNRVRRVRFRCPGGA